MAIDVVFAILMAYALYRGFVRGFIAAVFSLVACVIGLAAALKLSAVLAAWLGESGMDGRWWPVVCFFVIFLAVVVLIRLGAAALQKVVEWSMLGWLNRLGGILLYATLFTIVYSVLLWMANQLYLLNPETKLQSVVYPYIEPVGPWVMDRLGTIIPLFRDVFAELEAFFEGAAGKIPVQTP
ncbi:CvpA family protein [Chitinophaga sp.]|uniref:CvpA family protein n=1 Tax=Chitinophaga sp. TaxID=1869181 RepID=UPI002632F38B|nr:CvpA family protein [uncultured Chitinophaga sp.]